MIFQHMITAFIHCELLLCFYMLYIVKINKYPAGCQNTTIYLSLSLLFILYISIHPSSDCLYIILVLICMRGRSECEGLSSAGKG